MKNLLEMMPTIREVAKDDAARTPNTPWFNEVVLGPVEDGLRKQWVWTHTIVEYYAHGTDGDLCLCGPMQKDGAFVVEEGHGWSRRMVAKAMRHHVQR
jgi:hypothetical protein